MPAQPSFLSLVACALYALVALAAWWAGREARRKKQQAWHLTGWWLISGFFVFLIVSRLLGLEELLREELRALLQAQDLNEERRDIQGPIVSVVIIGFASAAMLALYWASRRVSGRRNIALATAIGACGVMCATIAMRLVSLHALDRLLNGPLKLNWVGDIGASLAVLVAAIIYVRIITGKPARRR